MPAIREQKPDEQKNVQFITLMQMIGCLLVIFGHSYPFATDIPSAMLRVREFIYLFHMHLFVWCSGYLLVYTNQTEKYTFSGFAFRRAMRLMVPYAVFSLMGLIPKIIFSRLNLINDKFDFGFLTLVRMFFIPRENVWGHFWFMPMIFSMGLIGFGLSKLIKKMKVSLQKPCWLLITVLTVFVSYLSVPHGEWLGVNDIIEYFWVFALGCFCALFRYGLNKSETSGPGSRPLSFLPPPIYPNCNFMFIRHTFGFDVFAAKGH